jgi:penicillin-binding protein A
MIIPAVLSVIFSFGLILLAVILFYSAIRKDNGIINGSELSPADSGPGPVVASRWIRYLRIGFVLLCFAVLGIHSYWAFFTEGPLGTDERFLTLKESRDQRNRRIQEAGLRGWVFDRHDSIDSALIRYKLMGSNVVRDYPLGDAGAHLIGYKSLLRGEAGIEKAYDDYLTTPTSTYNALVSPIPVGKDIVTTIDSKLQQVSFEQLSGKKGAIVVLDPKTGGILALASGPTFSPKNLLDDQFWENISQDEMNKPLVNRATNQYYLPGSSFKTVVAAAALTNGFEKEEFVCKEGGFIPPGSAKPIQDDQLSVHGRINFQRAFTVSCNQYFAQLGLKIGAMRLAETAKLFDIHIDESPEESRKTRIDSKVWNTESGQLSQAFGPNESRMMINQKIFSFDLAVQSIGQGYAQMTPLQMALIAAGVANNGQMLRPKLELKLAPVPLSAAMSPQVAAKMRQLMISVVKEGTARSAFVGSAVSAGGKTGTAQREVVVYNPKTGKPVMITDSRTGKQYPKTKVNIDAWFIGFAPAENPQVAFAVIVEDGGHGGAVAAPIARVLIEKAAELGLINPR